MERVMSGDDAERWEAEEDRREEIRRADPENIRQSAMFAKQMKEGCLILATPLGKSLQEPTEDILAEARFTLRRAHPRSIEAELYGLPGVTRVLGFKPNQIPKSVAEGRAAFGITGDDVNKEYGEYDERKDERIERLAICGELSYSRRTSGPTTAVLFTRADNPVNDVSQIAQGEKIATEYAMATIRLLFEKGIRATIVGCTGGAESLVISGECAYGVTLIETGDTLRANGLKVIGYVFKSNTVLIANRAALDIKGIREIADFLARKLKGVLAARERVYLVMNAPLAQVEDIRLYLRGLGATLLSPTISALLNAPMFCSIATVVPADDLNVVEMGLMKLGADGFVELAPSAIM